MEDSRCEAVAGSWSLATRTAGVVYATPPTVRIRHDSVPGTTPESGAAAIARTLAPAPRYSRAYPRRSFAPQDQ